MKECLVHVCKTMTVRVDSNLTIKIQIEKHFIDTISLPKPLTVGNILNSTLQWFEMHTSFVGLRLTVLSCSVQSKLSSGASAIPKNGKAIL